MRGAISLAAVLALPTTLDSGAAFAERDLLIFVTVGVIVVTLVGQGLTLPALMRLLGVEGDRIWSPDEAIARLEAAQAALDRLDELEEEGGLPEDRVHRLREVYQARFQRCVAVLGGDDADGRAAARDPVARYREVRRELIAVERATLLQLRNAGRLRADVVRLIERDLDLEEARLSA
jgi:CPA1 family monovalent cation:H+ antiporter